MEAVGVDLGGTWVRAGLVTESGRILTRARAPVDPLVPADQIVSAVAATVASVRPGTQPVGVGVPTTVTSAGRLRPCPNLPTLDGFALADALSERFRAPVVLDNDARCFAMGEWGSSGGVESLAAFTLGTSIGLGIVLGGVPVRGSTDEAGEIWRAPVPGTQDTLHDRCSAEAVRNSYASRTGNTADTAAIFRLASRGDEPALASIEAYASAFAWAVRVVLDIIDPAAVVVGGSISNSYEVIRPWVDAVVGGRASRIRRSVLGDDGGIIGAARLCAGRRSLQ